MLYCVSSKCKVMIFLVCCNKKIIIFFKKKILDKAGLTYYLCNENCRTKKLKGGVVYVCFIILKSRRT